MVEITGGEPLLQADVYPLMDRLLARGTTVMLETGGHVSLERVPRAVVKVMDVKCPGSGEAHRSDWDEPRPAGAARRGEVRPEGSRRLRVRARRRRASTRSRGAWPRCSSRPVHGVLPARDLAAWVLEDRLPVRVQLQVHKYIWDAGDEGSLRTKA